MTTIVTKNGSGAPLASDLVQGELAVDLTNKRLYTENSGGTVIEVGTNPSTIDINAGTIDGTVIGGASAAAGTFTTFTSTGIDDNATSTAITIDSSQNVGVGTASPARPLVVASAAYTDPSFAGLNATAVFKSSGISNVMLLSGTSQALLFGDTADGDVGKVEYNHSSDFMSLTVNASEAMRIDSSGNVGIGTDNPLNKLHVDGRIYLGDTTTFSGLFNDAGSLKLRPQGNSTTGEVTIDASGNVGIGVTPSAWDSVFKNIQMGGGGYSGSFYSQANGDISDGIVLNAYYNGGWKYTASSKTATQYEQNNGIHKWAVAPSGTAGNAISWSEAMRIDSSGNLLVGATSIGTIGSGVASGSMRVEGNFGSPGVYASTTALAANVYISTDGRMFRSTSSQRYKNTIQDATHGLTELLTLRPVTYKGNDDGDVVFGGLIAEEVHDAGLTEFVQYNDEQQPDSLSYSNMVSLCIKAIQEQQAMIEELKAEVAALKGA